MPIKFKIYKQLHLLYTEFNGQVTIKDAFEYAEKIFRVPNLEHVRKTLVFLKKSKLVFEIEEVEAFARKLSNNDKLIFRDKIAILIDSPNETVAATIYAQTVKSINNKVEIELFYTLDAALQFLNLTSKRDEIIELIFNPKGKKVR